MRFPVRKETLTAHPPHQMEEKHFLGRTGTQDRWLLHDSEVSLASLVIMQNNPWLLAPRHCFSQSNKEGGAAFSKAHGCELWDFTSQNPQVIGFSMRPPWQVQPRSWFLSHYKDGLDNIKSSVDVADGIRGHVVETNLIIWIGFNS